MIKVGQNQFNKIILEEYDSDDEKGENSDRKGNKELRDVLKEGINGVVGIGGRLAGVDTIGAKGTF